MKAFASSGPCGEIITTVSALLLITRAVNSAMALIEFCTSTEDSRPTSGTMIGGCGAMPAKTNELVWAIRCCPENQPQISADGHRSEARQLSADERRSMRIRISHRWTRIDTDNAES